MISNTSSRQVQSVGTAFRLVGLLQDLDGATTQDLASRLDLAKSTVHNYLGTLESLGYVVEREGTYRLGLRFLTHGMAAKSGLPDRDRVSGVLEALARDLSQPVWWIVAEHGRGLFVGSAAPEDGQAIYGRLGKRSYLHTHAPGKAILAQLPDEAVAEIAEYHGLPVHTRQTTTDLEALRGDLEVVRDRGYAVSDGEAALGIRSIGVAFQGSGGHDHALGVFGFSHDFGANREADVSAALQEAVETLRTPDGREG